MSQNGEAGKEELEVLLAEQKRAEAILLAAQEKAEAVLLASQDKAEAVLQLFRILST